MARAKRRGPKPKSKGLVSLKPLPFNGDHGTGTAAALQGTIMEPVDRDVNPNRMGRRRRVNVIETLTLTMRQQQAAEAIQEAFCRVEMLSSGGELKERVQSSPKPDATIAVQVDASSRWVRVMKAVKPVNRAIIEHVCCKNLPLVELIGYSQKRQRLSQTLDAVADHMGY